MNDDGENLALDSMSMLARESKRDEHARESFNGSAAKYVIKLVREVKRLRGEVARLKTMAGGYERANDYSQETTAMTADILYCLLRAISTGVLNVAEFNALVARLQGVAERNSANRDS